MGKRVDCEWDDSNAIPPNLDIVTLFTFDRMTDVTLAMVDQRNGGKVLDVGCGMGIDASQLVERGNNLVGLEPSNVMLKKADDWSKNKNMDVHLVQGVGESLPFKNGSFENVICKGALDHFYNPDEAIQQMAQTIKSNGSVIISVTNYESLSCILFKIFKKIRSIMLNKKITEKNIWDGFGKTKTYRIPGRDTCPGGSSYKKTKSCEIPTDHTYKFDYFVFKSVLNRHLEVESLVGVSLFWKLPYWREIIEKLPNSLALSMMTVCDKIARKMPIFSDVLVSKCRVKMDSTTTK